MQWIRTKPGGSPPDPMLTLLQSLGDSSLGDATSEVEEMVVGSFEMVQALGREAMGQDDYGERAEFLQLVAWARNLDD